MGLVLLAMASIGLTFVIEYSYIFNKPRRLLSKIAFFKELLSCSQCLGFWSGVFIALAYGFFALPSIDLFFTVVFGFAMSFAASFVDLIMKFIDCLIF